MSYGSAAGVVALVPRWGNAGSFTTATRPSLAQVNAWLEEVGSTLDIALSDVGFTVPITDSSVTPALDGFVNGEVAAMADGVHSSGKYGPSSKSGGGKSRSEIIMDTVTKFVKLHAAGIERMGATRAQSSLSGLGYRGVDEGNNSTFPLIQREAFSPGWINWDTQ